MFRVPFAMERMVEGSVSGPLITAYLANLTTTVNAITGGGAYAVIDPHNFGRFNGATITSTSDFQSFWNKLAAQFKDNSKVVFDTNNEYHDMDQTLVLDLNQAAIDGIRAAGATSQYIFAEGNSYSVRCGRPPKTPLSLLPFSNCQSLTPGFLRRVPGRGTQPTTTSQP